MFDVDTGVPVKVSGELVGRDVTQFAWAPNDSRVAYLADQDGLDTFELYTSLPDGTGNVRVSGALVSGGDVDVFACSPDSSRIAYLADQDEVNVFELYASAPDGSTNLRVSDTPIPGGNVEDDFAWAPSSFRVAYRANHDDVLVIDLYTTEAGLAELERHGQIAFRYSTASGDAPNGSDANPNGSVGDIAGIYNREKNVLGMMPHPERASEAILGNDDGFELFQSLRRHLGLARAHRSTSPANPTARKKSPASLVCLPTNGSASSTLWAARRATQSSAS